MGDGWIIRKEGKIAVRDVEAMGVAGGWFVLGIAWVVEQELEPGRLASSSAHENAEGPTSFRESEDDVLVWHSKGKGKASKASTTPLNGPRDRMNPGPSGPSSVEMSIESSNASTHDKTEESTMIKTPGIREEAADMVGGAARVEREYHQLRLLVRHLTLRTQ